MVLARECRSYANLSRTDPAAAPINDQTATPSLTRFSSAQPAGAELAAVITSELTRQHLGWQKFDGAAQQVLRDRLQERAAERMLPGPLLALARDRPRAVASLHDTTTKNVIVTPDGRFSGIVDIDDLCWGDPRFAAALTLAAIEAFGGSHPYVAAWIWLAKLRDDRLFRDYVVLFLPDFLAEQGTAANGNEAKPDTEECARILALLERAPRSAGVQGPH